uniref:Link domain-containing protein n=1 Tax=viral metagenome TaxID=1070528 RepID=A0A6C0IER8_9ZZZZ
MNTGSPKNNNLGTFYTNLGNSVNKGLENINKGLNSIGNNVNKGLNSVNKGLNSIGNNSKATNENISSLLPFKTNTANNVKNVSNNGNVTNITTNEWIAPLLIFIVVATVFIVIFVKFQDKISAGINNIIQKVRDAFNKSSTPPVDASKPPVTTVNEPPYPPQEEQQHDNAEQADRKTSNIFDKILPSGRPEVFNVSENEYTYYDAEPLCMALGAELATYDQVKDAWSKGADWCNYGWVKGQAAVYPTQDETWQKVQSGSDENRNSCGVPGLNGGYFENPEMKFGVNCYGVKPPQSNHSEEVLMKKGKIPLSVPALEVDKKIQDYKTQMDDIGVLPFSENQWSKQ